MPVTAQSHWWLWWFRLGDRQKWSCWMGFTVPSGNIFLSPNKGSCINWCLKYYIPCWLCSALVPPLLLEQWMDHRMLSSTGGCCAWWLKLIFKIPLTFYSEPYSISYTAVWRLNGFLWAFCFCGNMGDCNLTTKREENWGGKSKAIFSTVFKISISIGCTFTSGCIHTHIRRQIIAQDLSEQCFMVVDIIES